MNKNNLDQSELNREMILDLFYTTNGNLDEINRTIDEKLKIRGFRKITLFEEFVKNRLAVNPCLKWKYQPSNVFICVSILQ